MQVSSEELIEDWQNKTEFYAGMVPRSAALWARLWLGRWRALADQGLDAQLGLVRLGADLGSGALDALERTLGAVSESRRTRTRVSGR